jgi:flagellar hook-basal body complex protein FliE
MAIENVSGMNKMLTNYNTEDWMKSAATDQATAGGMQSFSEMLTKSLMDVNSMQQEADKAIQKLASGQTKNIHETMLAVENAEMAFKTMNQVRMKVIEAYKEIMRMQM